MSGLWAVSTLLCFATNALLGKGAQDWSHPAFEGGERCCARHQSCGKRGKEAGERKPLPRGLVLLQRTQRELFPQMHST